MNVEKIRENQVILHKKDQFVKEFSYLMSVFTYNKILYIEDLLKKINNSSSFLCFKDLVVGVSDKANLYFRDEFVKHNRKPIVNKFLEMIYEHYDLQDLQPPEWKVYKKAREKVLMKEYISSLYCKYNIEKRNEKMGKRERNIKKM